MGMFARVTLGLMLAATAGLGMGCGSSTTTGPTAADQEQQALQEVGEMYRMYVATAKKAPTKVNDFAGSRQISPTGYQAVADGKIVVRMGAMLSDTSEEGDSKDSADEVLAFDAKTPTSGGPVLMLNRKVKTMTADEFKSAKKAGTEDSAPLTAAAKAKAK